MNKIIRTIPTLYFLLISSFLPVFGQKNPPKKAPIELGSRLELFVDTYLIDKISGEAELRMHHPIPRERVMTYDAPWEGSGSGYHSVFKDGDTYRMYYKAWQHNASADTSLSHPLYCAYAESNDGITWHKPKLGIHNFKGSKENNIVLVSGLTGGLKIDAGHPAVFKDDNPQAGPDAKYKAVVALENPDYGLAVFKSPDGVHWTLHEKGLMLKNGHFDSQNTAFWDVNAKQYRAYWRQYSKSGVRGIRTATSPNLFDWSERQDLTYEDSPDEHLYTNQIKPYHRAPHIFIGLPMRYVDRGWSESMRALPELEEREKRAGKTVKGGVADLTSRYGTVLTETLLMSSRDGVTFKRWNEAFLKPGIERNGSWTYGDNCTAWHVVETKSDLPGAPNELSLYTVENYWKGRASSLRRYTLRLDGFVSLKASYKGGEIVTKPFTFSGDHLWLNFSTSAAGSVLAEIQDETGKAIPGFSLSESESLFGDSIAKKVRWKNRSSLAGLRGKVVRLKFVLKDTDLYSLQFSDDAPTGSR
ncbi:hypothetical protein ACFPMF_19310 [Larkinella bovis]|uniref:Glycosyl hydrolase family 32 n=1 Tax=Larkinella bovis TaxID=683041 RepID=A0ABW0IGI1_9BACT